MRPWPRADGNLVTSLGLTVQSVDGDGFCWQKKADGKSLEG
jgi:hypothetical protein